MTPATGPDPTPTSVTDGATAADVTPGVTKKTADTLELGSGLPGWILRPVLLLAGLGAASVLLGSGLDTIGMIFILLFAVVTPAIPATPAPAILIGAVAVAVTIGNGDALRPEVLVEIPLLHLVHVTASLSALIPLRAVIRPAALLRPIRRFVLVQAVTFAVVGVAELLPTGRNPTVVEIAGLIASTGLVIVAIRAVVGRR